MPYATTEGMAYPRSHQAHAAQDRGGGPTEQKPHEPYEPTWRERHRILAVIVEVIEGLGWGCVVIAILATTFFLVPMRMLRAEMEEQGSLSIPPSAMLPATRLVRESENHLPAISYDLTFTNEENAGRVALARYVMKMRVPILFDVPNWFLTPYVTESLPPWQTEPSEDGSYGINDMINGLYYDKPELSVYTDGMCTCIAGAVCRFRFAEADGTTTEQNIREYQEVTERLDAVAGEIAERMGTPEMEELRRRSGDDRLYITLAYDWVTKHVRYSDDVDDTSHANDVYGAMVDGESKCYGAAGAIKALLDRGDIPSFVAYGGVGGSDSDEGHAWVIARIDRQWLVIDAAGTADHELATGDVVADDVLNHRGRWWNCLCPLDGYLKRNSVTLERRCEKLMEAYGELVAVTEEERAVGRPAIVLE